MEQILKEIDLYFRKVNLAVSSRVQLLWIDEKQEDQLRDQYNNPARGNNNLDVFKNREKEKKDITDISDYYVLITNWI